ncbi:MAG: lysostaphin resistance A-like protein [Bacteroidota bacterium]
MTEYYERPQPTPQKELFYLILFWIGGSVASIFATMIIWLIMTGKSIMSIQTDLLKPENLSAFMMIQVVSTIFMFFLPAYMSANLRRGKPLQELGFQSSFKARRVFISVAIMLSVLPLVGFLAEVNEWIPISPSLKKIFDSMESDYMEQIKKFAVFKTPVDYIIALIVIALTPAIVEETFFRGSMQQIFRRWFVHPWLVITITSFIFSAIHFSWYGFLPRVALGMMLGGIFYYTGNLWYSIAAHFFNNALMVSVLYGQTLQGKPIDTEVGNTAPWWAGLASLIIVVYLFRYLREISTTKVAEDSIAIIEDQSDSA